MESWKDGLIDNTLTTTGKAADAKKVGDEIANLKGNLNYRIEVEAPKSREIQLLRNDAKIFPDLGFRYGITQYLNNNKSFTESNQYVSSELIKVPAGTTIKITIPENYYVNCFSMTSDDDSTGVGVATNKTNTTVTTTISKGFLICAWKTNHPVLDIGDMSKSIIVEYDNVKYNKYEDLAFVYNDSTKASYNAGVLLDAIANQTDRGIKIVFDERKKLYLGEVQIEDCHNVYFIGGNLNATFIIGDGNEYTFENCQNIHFENIVFDNDDNTKDAIVGNTCFYLYVIGCTFKNCKTSISTNPESTAHQIIRRGVISGNKLTGYPFCLKFDKNGDNYYSIGDIEISNNHLLNALAESATVTTELQAGYSVYAKKVDGLKLVGNTLLSGGVYIDECEWSMIESNNIFVTKARGIYANKARNLIISGNNIAETGIVKTTDNLPPYVYGQGIMIENGLGGISINGNNFAINRASAIRLKSTNGSVVSNNTIRSASGFGNKVNSSEPDLIPRNSPFISVDINSVNNEIYGNAYREIDAYSWFVDETAKDDNDIEDVENNKVCAMLASEYNKNLLNILGRGESAVTENGITYQILYDGTVMLFGTATDTVTIPLGTQDNIKDFHTGRRYGVSMQKHSIVPAYIKVTCDGSTLVNYVYTKNKFFVPQTVTALTISMIIPNGTAIVNPVCVYPMIKKDFVESIEWTPYNGNTYDIIRDYVNKTWAFTTGGDDLITISDTNYQIMSQNFIDISRLPIGTKFIFEVDPGYAVFCYAFRYNDGQWGSGKMTEYSSWGTNVFIKEKEYLRDNYLLFRVRRNDNGRIYPEEGYHCRIRYSVMSNE